MLSKSPTSIVIGRVVHVCAAVVTSFWFAASAARVVFVVSGSVAVNFSENPGKVSVKFANCIKRSSGEAVSLQNSTFFVNVFPEVMLFSEKSVNCVASAVHPFSSQSMRYGVVCAYAVILAKNMLVMATSSDVFIFAPFGYGFDGLSCK